MGRRAALYSRVSTADQSCERHECDLRAFAERSGCEIVGVFRETASGLRNDCSERRRVMALAQPREIDVILVTELSRWGRSTIDLLHTLRDLEAHCVSLAALNGMTFDLSTSVGRMMATMIAGLAEFERDLLSERVRSGLAAARARGKKLGRQPGQRRKSDRYAARVMALSNQGLSYRLIARDLGRSKTTAAAIVQRHRAADVPYLLYKGI
jgi:DNA invertase Pin-like site-specific DNA recombinase